jgi:beta-1,4-mannosyltransferase
MCLFRNTRLIIDWHNFGYSILALKLGDSHPIVKISKVYEQMCAGPALAHLTVTTAMAKVLKTSFGVTALPLHDRPPKHFQPLSSEQRTSFLERRPETAKYARELHVGTRKLIVSATSWTPDEDFSLLLDALVTYSAKVTTKPGLPKILAIITGKGPQKEQYLSKIQQLNREGKLSNIDVKTAWLSMEDYASLLGAADLGISLHTSSSGVDLPMKVVDMFGTGLPVLGWSKFEAWPELVTECVNGMGFGSAHELSDLLVELFEGSENLKRLRSGALQECKRRWDEEWDPIAGKLLGLVN